jgi:hypothetical protein
MLDRSGTIEEGKRADLVLLQEIPCRTFRTPPASRES